MNKGSRSGTTLIEVIVALFVISTVSVGSITIVQTSFSSAMMTRDRIAAQNLAREGIEGVRKIISTNLIRYSDLKCWNTVQVEPNFKPNCSEKLEGKYKLNFNQPADAQLEVLLESTTDNFKINPPDLQLNPKFQIKNISANESVPEKFHRIIEISYSDLDLDKDKMKVVSTVAWMSRGQITEMEIEESFRNNY